MTLRVLDTEINDLLSAYIKGYIDGIERVQNLIFRLKIMDGEDLSPPIICED